MIISADAAIDAIAKRSGGPNTAALRESLLEIWGSVAGDLDGEEANAVLFALSPQTYSVGSSNHRAARLAVARALYPSETPAKAVARFRRVLARASVRAVIDAIRAEETLYTLASRSRVRELLWEMATERAPVDDEGMPKWEPKDVAAHNRNRLAALKDIVSLDRLAEPAPAPALIETAPDEGKKKLLTRLGKVWDKSKRGD